MLYDGVGEHDILLDQEMYGWYHAVNVFQEVELSSYLFIYV